MKTRKIVINVCYGGFGLSDAAMREYAKRKGIKLYVEGVTNGLLRPIYWIVPESERVKMPFGKDWDDLTEDERHEYSTRHNKEILYDRDIPRDDPDLVAIVEEMGEGANDECADLKIVEIPESVNWYIEEYDGNEHVAEKHRKWS